MNDWLDEDKVEKSKARMRSSRRAERAAVPDSVRPMADGMLLQSFINSGLAERFSSFFVYNSTHTEAGTAGLINWLKEAGKAVYLPRVIGKTLEAVPLSESFSKGPFGIMEPIGPAFDGDIDAAIIPAFAFDLHGGRLGYGGGYYDRFLDGRNIFKIGYAYDFQIVKAVPLKTHDVLMDYLVTDKRARPVISSPPANVLDEDAEQRERAQRLYEGRKGLNLAIGKTYKEIVEMTKKDGDDETEDD